MKKVSIVMLSLFVSASTLAVSAQKFGRVIEFSHTRNGVTKQDAFDQAVKEADIVVVDFYGEHCGPCKQLSPRLDELAKEMPHVKFLKVNTSQHNDISSKFGVRSVPQLFFFKNGVFKKEARFNPLAGCRSKEEIKTSISKLG